ncbi:DUF397 domain-containing protein [Solihabitans fulvus]|uniref:DUF397 domain-containing protein n=1 Tax=Solihabitans fulvus TaxID=1892852 RepID=A0A5B2XAE9_9PSEU|nr:DUF397 domain-containing protein [Solihabitans fulvus]KAA2260090.1 DUF397 domain-containing protein [Solihabitans fulvus]
MTVWRKSSYSSGQENCVEMSWRKSSHSDAQENCVEVGHAPTHVGFRDSKNPDGAVLTFTRAELAAFLGAAKADRLTG